MMQLFKGRSVQTVRMKGKPIKEGYNFFAICDSATGLVWNVVFDKRLHFCGHRFFTISTSKLYPEEHPATKKNRSFTLFLIGIQPEISSLFRANLTRYSSLRITPLIFTVTMSSIYMNIVRYKNSQIMTEK